VRTKAALRDSLTRERPPNVAFWPSQTYINATYIKVMTKRDDILPTVSFEVRRLDARDSLIFVTSALKA
jgi:hypothetical protein